LPRGVYIRTKKRPGPNKGNGRGYNWVLDHASHYDHDCLKWPFSRDTKGYGTLGYNGKVLRAHRVMCQIAWGDPPSPEHQAAHTCGRGHLGCVNPMHLSWKTSSENQLDRKRHGTVRTNKTGSRTPLTPIQIADIRSLIGRETVTAIAAKFGISRRTVERVRAGRQYKPPGGHPLTIKRREKRRSNYTAAMGTTDG
jgi:hypothetical protein